MQVAEVPGQEVGEDLPGAVTQDLVPIGKAGGDEVNVVRDLTFSNDVLVCLDGSFHGDDAVEQLCVFWAERGQACQFICQYVFQGDLLPDNLHKENSIAIDLYALVVIK